MVRYMKMLVKTAALGMLMVTGAGAADNPWDIRLPFKSATITYEISGMESGRETHYIGDYGKKQARFRKTSGKVMYQQMNTDKVEITTEKWFYDIDLAARTGRKTTNPNRYFQQEYEKLSKKEKQTVRKNAEEMGKSVISGMQGTVEKNAATLLGYRCDKTTFMGTTVYTIHDTGIALKTETSMMGMSSKSVAVKLDKGAVPRSVFIPPKGIEITFDHEADAMMQKMAKNMINSLKDPEAAKKMKRGQTGHAQQPPAEGDPAAREMREAEASEETAGRDEHSDEPDDTLQKSLEGLKGLFGN